MPYQVLSYNLVSDEIIPDDILKISIFMDKCRNKKDNSIEHNVTEHIFTIVNRIENDKIYVSINNHMFFEPYYNPNALLKDNIIVIKINE